MSINELIFALELCNSSDMDKCYYCPYCDIELRCRCKLIDDVLDFLRSMV